MILFPISCPICGDNIDTSKFKDELSLKEFRISGMCQRCQDEFFDGEFVDSDEFSTIDDSDKTSF